MWNEDVKFGPPLPKKMRTVSPTLACSGLSLVSAPTAPLKTKYSGRSSASLSKFCVTSPVAPIFWSV
jgi:hypothetical protein